MKHEQILSLSDSVYINYRSNVLTQAAINVGGIVLNALAIEHFILRHPCESKHV